MKAGAKIKKNVYHSENPLHWAFYFANQSLIEMILKENYTLFFEQNQAGLYPIDFLFYEYKPKKFKYIY